MPKAWSKKDERKYEHVKSSAKKRGESTKRAKEIAARTVNRDRTSEGRAKSGSSSSRNGGKTKEQLYREAKRLGVEGRSKMNKSQLQRAVSRKK